MQLETIKDIQELFAEEDLYLFFQRYVELSKKYPIRLGLEVDYDKVDADIKSKVMHFRDFEFVAKNKEVSTRYSEIHMPNGLKLILIDKN